MWDNLGYPTIFFLLFSAGSLLALILVSIRRPKPVRVVATRGQKSTRAASSDPSSPLPPSPIFPSPLSLSASHAATPAPAPAVPTAPPPSTLDHHSSEDDASQRGRATAPPPPQEASQSADETSEDLIDALEEQKDEVEFFVLSPDRVPDSHEFNIRVEIDKLSKISIGQEADDAPNLETLITQIQRGSRVALAMQSKTSGPNKPLTVFAPFQALTWRNETAAAVFILHSPPTRDSIRTENTVWIMINGISIGRLRFNVDVNPDLYKPTPDKEQHRQGISSAHLAGEIAFAKTNALPVRRAFICYEHKNWREVPRASQPLEAAGIKCLVDNLDLPPTSKWEAEVNRWLQNVDMVLVFWSETIQTRPSTALELELLQREIARRQNIDAPELIVDLIINDGSQKTVPPWLRKCVRAWKRWETFEAYHKAHASEEEFARAYESVAR
jgi:TIR domain